jgi:hypothetical protein
MSQYDKKQLKIMLQQGEIDLIQVIGKQHWMGPMALCGNIKIILK